jgi:Phage tail tube protein, GTA-gp10
MTLTNPFRGEAAFDMDGRSIVLRLTLGSLAALEQALGTDGLKALGERLMGGKLSTQDILHVLSAGFHGAGEVMSPSELGKRIPASALEHAALTAAKLLAVSFGAGDSSLPPSPQTT